MTDTIEAVARVLATMLEGGREYDQMPATRRELKIWNRAGMCSINDATQEDAREAADHAIAAHTKALIEGAGEIEKRLMALKWMVHDEMRGLIPDTTAHEAAATIAALRTEVERAKMDGVRAGIEAAAKWLNCAADLAGPGPYKSLDVPIRKQCLRDAAEGVLSGAMDFVPDTRAAALSDLIAGDADLIVPDTLADSDGDDGA